MNHPAKSSHLGRIDVLRAFAILMVVCFHYLPSVTGQYELEWGGMAGCSKRAYFFDVVFVSVDSELERGFAFFCHQRILYSLFVFEA